MSGNNYRSDTSLRALSRTYRRAANLLQGPTSRTLVYSALVQGAGAVSGISLARGLGVEGRGLLGQLQVWPMLLGSLALVGMFDAVTHQVARQPQSKRASEVLSSALFITSISGSIAVILGLLAVAQFGVGGTRRGAAVAFAFYPLLNMSALVAMGTLMGLGELSTFNRLRVATVALPALIFVTTYATGHLSIELAVGSVLGANFLVLLTALTRLRMLGVGGELPKAGRVRLLFHYGIRAHTGTVSATLNERLDQLLIAVLLPAGPLGLYIVAVTATSPVALIGSSQSLLALPDSSKASSSDDDRRAVLRRHLGVSLVLSIVASAIAFPLLPIVIPWLFGADFAAAVPTARILVVAAVSMNVARVGGALLRGTGRPLAPGLAEAAAVVVTGLLLLALLSPLGIVGAAIASVAAYTTAASIVLGQLRRDIFPLLRAHR